MRGLGQRGEGRKGKAIGVIIHAPKSPRVVSMFAVECNMRRIAISDYGEPLDAIVVRISPFFLELPRLLFWGFLLAPQVQIFRLSSTSKVVQLHPMSRSTPIWIWTILFTAPFEFAHLT